MIKQYVERGGQQNQSAQQLEKTEITHVSERNIFNHLKFKFMS